MITIIIIIIINLSIEKLFVQFPVLSTEPVFHSFYSFFVRLRGKLEILLDYFIQIGENLEVSVAAHITQIN